MGAARCCARGLVGVRRRRHRQEGLEAWPTLGTAMARGRAAAELVTRCLAAAELFVGSTKRRDHLSMTLGVACLGATRSTEEHRGMPALR